MTTVRLLHRNAYTVAYVASAAAVYGFGRVFGIW